MKISVGNLHQYLGSPRFLPEGEAEEEQMGVAVGLAWTMFGGEILFVEASSIMGRQNLILTGHLGDVMKESAQAALTYVRSRTKQLGLEKGLFDKTEIHIHVPAGATPKDGPSAGVTMATALVSALTKIPVRNDIAMTGEITLRGRVLPVGGIKEKSLAALRAKINNLILPALNKKDIEEIPKNIRSRLNFIFVKHMDEVIEHTLKSPPSASKTSSKKSTPAKAKSKASARAKKSPRSSTRRASI